MIELSNPKVSEINSNPIVTNDAMAIVRSVPSEKTWDSLFQTLVKVFRLQEAEDTISVFDNYSDNQEFSLKQQEIMNRVTNGTVRAYMGQSTQEMAQSNKAELIDQFTQYIQQDHVRSKLKGNVIFNSRDVTYRINSSELKTRFKSNHKEGDTKIVYCRSSFNKPCIVKAKDIDILILMIYTYAVQQPEQDWYMQTDKDSFISIRKIYENLASTTCLLLPQFHAVTGWDMVSFFFKVSKRVVFERVSSGITPFNMIVELGSSNIITESVNNEVIKFIQRYVYRGKEAEGIVETRMR